MSLLQLYMNHLTHRLYHRYMPTVLATFAVLVAWMLYAYPSIHVSPHARLQFHEAALTRVLYFFLGVYAYTLVIYYLFEQDFTTSQLVYTLKRFQLHYTFALDNLGLLFLLLTSCILPMCLLVHYRSHLEIKSVSKLQALGSTPSAAPLAYTLVRYNKSFDFLLTLLAIYAILFLFFTTTDLFVFYTLFERSMIPLFLWIGFYGANRNRLKAATYLFFYTMGSSMTFLFALFLILTSTGTTQLSMLHFLHLDPNMQVLLWCLLFVPAAAKIPIFPLHIWLPEAHVEAPTEGSVLLRRLMLKLGAYLLLRFLLPLFPYGTTYLLPAAYVLFVLSLVYTSFLIFNQVDLKKIVAYSSIRHMNLALLGLFSGTVQGIQGRLFLFFTHGLVSSGLFMGVGSLYLRFHTRVVHRYSGLTMYFPVFSVLFFLFTLGNLAFPGTGSFIGELLILLGVFQKNLFLGFWCLVGSFLCTGYSILLYTRTFFGIPFRFLLPTGQQPLALFHQCRLSFVETRLMRFLAIFMLFSGLFPNVYLNFVRAPSLYLSLLFLA